MPIKNNWHRTDHVKIIMEGSDLSELFKATPALMQTTGIAFYGKPFIAKRDFWTL
jgi:hypothetical protein